MFFSTCVFMLGLNDAVLLHGPNIHTHTSAGMHTYSDQSSVTSRFTYEARERERESKLHINSGHRVKSRSTKGTSCSFCNWNDISPLLLLLLLFVAGAFPNILLIKELNLMFVYYEEYHKNANCIQKLTNTP